MLSSFRSAVLKNLRIPVAFPGQETALPALSSIISRGFAGGFLEKGAVTERVMHVAKHFEKVDPVKVTPTATFDKDLGLDSLDTVELVMAMEEEFGIEIPDAEADKISSISDAVNYVISNPLSK